VTEKKEVGTTKSWPIGRRDKESVYEIHKPLFLIIDSKPVILKAIIRICCCLALVSRYRIIQNTTWLGNLVKCDDN